MFLVSRDPPSNTRVHFPRLHTLAFEFYNPTFPNARPFFEEAIYSSLERFIPFPNSFMPSHVYVRAFAPRVRALVACGWRENEMNLLIPHFLNLESLVIPIILVSSWADQLKMAFQNMPEVKLREVGIFRAPGSSNVLDESRLVETIEFFSDGVVFPLVRHIRVLASLAGLASEMWEEWVLILSQCGILLDSPPTN
jgi:hypothetical protein